MQKGPASQQSLAELNQTVHDLAGAHFVAAKTFLPELADQKGSSYTFITGVGGERVMSNESSLVTVGASMLMGLSKVFRHEFKDQNVQVNEVRQSTRSWIFVTHTH